MSEEDSKKVTKKSRGHKSLKAQQRFQAISQPGKRKLSKKKKKDAPPENKKVARARNREFYSQEKNRQGRCVRYPRQVRIMRYMRENTSDSFSRLLGEDASKKKARNIFLPEFNQVMVNGVDSSLHLLMTYAYEFANARHNYADRKDYRLLVSDLEAAKKIIFSKSHQ